MRRKLVHAELVSETSAQLLVHFKPEPKLIKKRIEHLIEREYLERSPTDARLYHYVS
eukprot:SAG22_NODE_1204_length_5172_cov_4.546028_5_plen_57_part_00